MLTLDLGWKSIFAIGQNTSHINDVSEYESKALMKWFLKLIAENHDLQVRMRWHNVNDVGELLSERASRDACAALTLCRLQPFGTIAVYFTPRRMTSKAHVQGTG